MERIKESEIQRSICDYLALKGYFFWRQNTAPTYDKTRGTFRAMPKYAMKGVPDIIVLKDGKFIGIEVKTEVGRLSKEQKVFAENCMLNGGQYVVARSIDDLQRTGL